MRAPEAPIGCPSATAPPLTLTRSSSMPSMRIEFSVTEANASLISHRSMSPGCRPAFSSAFLRGARRRRRQVGEVVGALRVGDDLRQRLLAVGLRPLLGGQHQRAAAVVDARRVAGGVRALLADQAGQRRQALQRGVAARALVDLDDRVALASLDRHRDGLVGHAALVDRRQRALVRAQRPAVEVRARHLQLVADLGAPRRTSACRRTGWSARRGPSRRASWRRPCGSRSALRAAGRAPWTSTPCRRRRRPACRRRGSPGRGSPRRAAPTRRPC